MTSVVLKHSTRVEARDWAGFLTHYIPEPLVVGQSWAAVPDQKSLVQYEQAIGLRLFDHHRQLKLNRQRTARLAIFGHRLH